MPCNASPGLKIFPSMEEPAVCDECKTNGPAHRLDELLADYPLATGWSLPEPVSLH